MKSINFKQDPFHSFIRLSNMIIPPMAVLVGIGYALVVAVLFIFRKFLVLVSPEFSENKLDFGLMNVDQVTYKIHSALPMVKAQPATFIIGFMIILFIILLVALLINIILQIAEGKINNQKSLIQFIIAKAFHYSWIRIFVVLCLYLISYVGFAVLIHELLLVSFISEPLFQAYTLSPTLYFIIQFILYTLVYYLIFFRFAGSFAAIGIGGKGLFPALGFSWQNIHWGRSLGLLGIFAFSYIVYVLLNYVLTELYLMFEINVSPFVNMVIHATVNFPVNIIFFSFLASGLTLLYYRYEDPMTFSADDHLLEEGEIAIT